MVEGAAAVIADFHEAMRKKKVEIRLQIPYRWGGK